MTEFPAVTALLWFLVYFVYRFFSFPADESVEQILDEVSSDSSKLEQPMTGFVGMEYFSLIFNRTFVVFIAPDGLYGWKARGSVDCSSPNFYTPYSEMLTDKDLMTDLRAVRKLSRLKGGFFIPRAQIQSADVIEKQKWGMGPIRHVGRIRLQLVSGKSREFILLGNVYPEGIRESIVAPANIGGRLSEPAYLK